MKFKFFMIPACDAEKEEDGLNSFCLSHKIASVKKEFVSTGVNSFWSFCVTYIPRAEVGSVSKKKTIDYREILNNKDFAIFAKLRKLRKDLAQEEGVPAYALFTNEQLAALVTDKILTPAAMAKIPGIGKARIEKYGEKFINAVKNEIAAGMENTKEDTIEA